MQNKLNPTENKMLDLNENKLNSNTFTVVLKTQGWFFRMHAVFTRVNFISVLLAKILSKRNIQMREKNYQASI